jgi:hypothetical protein
MISFSSIAEYIARELQNNQNVQNAISLYFTDVEYYSNMDERTFSDYSDTYLNVLCLTGSESDRETYYITIEFVGKRKEKQNSYDIEEENGVKVDKTVQAIDKVSIELEKAVKSIINSGIIVGNHLESGFKAEVDGVFRPLPDLQRDVFVQLKINASRKKCKGQI